MALKESSRGGLLRTLLSDSAVYGLGGVASQAVAVLLVPIYANVLGNDGVGVNAVVNATLTLAMTITGLALPQAFLRWFLKESETDAQRRDVLSASLGLRLVASFAGALLTALLVIPLALGLYGSSRYLPIFLVIPVVVFFDSAAAIPLSFLRGVRRARAYAALSFLRALFGSTLIVLFVVVLHFGVIGVVAGSAVASILSAAAGAAVLARARLLRMRVDPGLWRAMLAFSLPLVPAALAGWTLNLSDRYILQAMTSESTVGVYALGYTAGLAVNALAVQPFAIAWGATYWELSKRDDARQLFALVLTAFLGLASFAALLLAALGTDVIRALLRPEFEPSRFVVPFSAFAYVLYGVFTVVTTGINLESQTRRLPLTMGLAALTGVVANLVLIPIFSYLGAAVATLIAYGVLVVASGRASQRYYPVPWRVSRALIILGVAGALSAAALLGPDHLLWRLACVAAYPPVLLASGVLSIRQLRAVRAALSRRSR